MPTSPTPMLLRRISPAYVQTDSPTNRLPLHLGYLIFYNKILRELLSFTLLLSFLL